MNSNRINAGTRIASMVLDYLVMSILAVLLVIPFGLLNLFKILTKSPSAVSESVTGLSNKQDFYLFLFAVVLYLCKDCFDGRSIAKRILKLQVVSFKNNKSASITQCIVRNLLVPLWPIEVLLIMINPERRLGDVITGTKIAHYKKATVQVGEVETSLFAEPE